MSLKAVEMVEPCLDLDTPVEFPKPKPFFRAPKTTAAAALIASLLFTKWVRKKSIKKCTFISDLTGKTVIVTGGNAGIGRVTAMLLAKRNATVIIGCRNEADGLEAVKEIQRATGNQKVSCKKLDLCNFDSVQKFVDEVKETGHGVNILINNAGVISSGGKRIITKDGCEQVMQANYFGHFLLTLLLTDVLKKSAPSRIINYASFGHRWGHLDLNDLSSEDYDEAVYYKAKLANVLFTRELSKRLQQTGVTVNVVNPGFTNTNYLEKAPFLRGFVLKILYMFYGKTPFEGAQTTLYVAMCPNLEQVSGRYFSNCKVRNLPKASRDLEKTILLFERSLAVVGLDVIH